MYYIELKRKNYEKIWSWNTVYRFWRGFKHPFDSEWVEVEAEDEIEAIKIATKLGYTMPNGFVSNSLTVEVQL